MALVVLRVDRKRLKPNVEFVMVEANMKEGKDVEIIESYKTATELVNATNIQHALSRKSRFDHPHLYTYV